MHLRDTEERMPECDDREQVGEGERETVSRENSGD